MNFYLLPSKLNLISVPIRFIPYSSLGSRFSSTMSTKMKIFTDAGNPFSLRVLASCYATNTDIDWRVIDRKNFKVPGFSGKLPVIEAKPRKYLFNTNSACCYIFDQSNQASASASNKEKVDELVEWDAQKLQAAVLPLLAAHVADSQKATKSCDSLTDLLSTLNGLIQNNQYLLGSSLTAADVIIWGSLYGVMQINEMKDVSGKYPALLNWFQSLSAMEPFLKAVQKVTNGKGISAFKQSLENYHSPYSHQKTVHHYKSDSSGDTLNEDGDEVTPQQLEHAKNEWLKGKSDMKPKQYQHPILPEKGEKNVFITSALPYVNNVPHLGNIIGCVLSADVYARFCRLRNYNILYLCGTDEYGTATETKALAEGVTPQEICDKYFRIHADIYKWFNISFDYFGRTSTKQQTEIAQDIFWKIHKNGRCLEEDVDQLQCVSCNMFLADRFVEGTCPFCKFEDARGDQCDACGKLINAVELINPKCKQCHSAPVLKTSRHIFLDLPKIESQLRKWLDSSKEANWTHNAKKITQSWLSDGLKPRCITRDLKWGTPVPLDGFTNKVFYVWFDAPIGYISITANYTSEWEKWWKSSGEVKYVQFMAKDNVPFHSVVFPATLMAADDNYILVNEIVATEYLNYEDDKFSKSRGVGVFGDHAESTGIPADIFRFYLLFVRPESQDSAFQWSDFVLKNNSELLNNLGNFVNRALMFLKNHFNSTMPELKLTDEEYKLVAAVNRDLNSYVEHLDKMKLRDGLRYVLNISRSGNQYIQSNKPWLLVKGTEEEKSRAGTVIGLAANISALISILLHPYMPDTSGQLQEQIQLPPDSLIIPKYFVPLLPTGHKIGEPSPLFQKLDVARAEELRQRFQGTRSDTNSKNSKANKAEKTPCNETNENIDVAKVAELEILVTQQGDAVRKVKAEKASKDVIDAEVKKLLELKNTLAISKGLDPNELKKGKSKNKKTGNKKK